MFRFCRGTLVNLGREKVELGNINLNKGTISVKIHGKAEFGTLTVGGKEVEVTNSSIVKGLALNRLMKSDVPDDIDGLHQTQRNLTNPGLDDRYGYPFAPKVFCRLLSLLLESQISGDEIYQDLQVDGYTLPCKLTPRHGGGWIPRLKDEKKTIISMVDFLNLVYKETAQLKVTGKP